MRHPPALPGQPHLTRLQHHAQQDTVPTGEEVVRILLEVLDGEGPVAGGLVLPSAT